MEMLEEIIQNINDSIEALDIFQKIHGICERVQEVTVTPEATEIGAIKIFPAEYANDGEYTNVELDNNKSTFYTRRNGDVSISPSDEDGEIGCQGIITQTIPIRMVGVVYKCDTDNSYRDEKQVQNIMHAVYQLDNRGLSTTLTIDSIQFNPVNYSVDRYNVISEEFENVNIMIPFESIAFYIDWEIVITSQQDCFEDYVCNCGN